MCFFSHKNYKPEENIGQVHLCYLCKQMSACFPNWIFLPLLFFPRASFFSTHPLRHSSQEEWVTDHFSGTLAFWGRTFPLPPPYTILSGEENIPPYNFFWRGKCSPIQFIWRGRLTSNTNFPLHLDTPDHLVLTLSPPLLNGLKIDENSRRSFWPTFLVLVDRVSEHEVLFTISSCGSISTKCNVSDVWENLKECLYNQLSVPPSAESLNCFRLSVKCIKDPVSRFLMNWILATLSGTRP